MYEEKLTRSVHGTVHGTVLGAGATVVCAPQPGATDKCAGWYVHISTKLPLRPLHSAGEPSHRGDVCLHPELPSCTNNRSMDPDVQRKLTKTALSAVGRAPGRAPGRVVDQRQGCHVIPGTLLPAKADPSS